MTRLIKPDGREVFRQQTNGHAVIAIPLDEGILAIAGAGGQSPARRRRRQDLTATHRRALPASSATTSMLPLLGADPASGEMFASHAGGTCFAQAAPLTRLTVTADLQPPDNQVGAVELSFSPK